MGPHTVYEVTLTSPDSSPLKVSKCFDDYAPVRKGDSVALVIEEKDIFINLDVKAISYHPDRRAMYVKLGNWKVSEQFMRALRCAQDQEEYVDHAGWYPESKKK
jgi:hypothetical protein